MGGEREEGREREGRREDGGREGRREDSGRGEVQHYSQECSNGLIMHSCSTTYLPIYELDSEY